MRILVKFDRIEKLISLTVEFFQVLGFATYGELVHTVIPEDESFEIGHFFPVFHDRV